MLFNIYNYDDYYFYFYFYSIVFIEFINNENFRSLWSLCVTLIDHFYRGQLQYAALNCHYSESYYYPISRLLIVAVAFYQIVGNRTSAVSFSVITADSFYAAMSIRSVTVVTLQSILNRLVSQIKVIENNVAGIRSGIFF